MALSLLVRASGWTLVLGGALTAGCGSKPPSVIAPAPCPTASPSPVKGSNVIVTTHCSLEYAAGGLRDARTLAPLIERYTAALKREFVVEGGAVLFDHVVCRVHQMGMPTALAGEGVATTLSTSAEGQYSADIFVLASSLHSATAKTALGDPMDAAYVAKTLAHELATIPIERSFATKKAGFGRTAMPRWFVQGFEEYLALTITSSRGTAATAKYAQRVVTKPDRVRFGPADIAVDDAYGDGATLIAFLVDEWGAAAPHRVLLGDQTTFYSALVGVTGLDVAALGARFRAWLGKQPIN